MIKTELLNGGKLIRHFSDNGKKLSQKETGLEYDEAIDIIPCRYTYKETDNEVKIEEASL